MAASHRRQGLDRLELIRFLQVAQTITVHHGAWAYLLGISALRASAAGRILEARIRSHYTDRATLELIVDGDDVDRELRFLAADVAGLLNRRGAADA